ncbi:hypothetical protein A3E17_05030 [Candidatus Amesbacteria bacterium RIFCSPHIGHO2_12_FULL_48_14]|uniref:VWFA domain-containing protein n=1 Tax=Candidatus Amesbacteria bacterium RIFCSPHIGHO2_12_FULL_48_14 TaxID=1797257 RepID=A0A1F4Z725_9BACT|nr:MAG: hypothetical protein A3E17_05030 [Candidatus Amesbacteria bacterium RIFCSPHIGHO2_12_FULL_48_14]
MNHKGAVSIILVAVVTMLAVFLLAGWQSRILLSVLRQEVLSDMLKVGYNSESEIYDIVARFVGDYPEAFSFDFDTQRTLDDGTKMRVVGIKTGEKTELTVTANREYATNVLKLSKEDVSTGEDIYDRARIVVNIDCTGSMNGKADASCSGSGCTTRIHEAKAAISGFAQAVKTYNDEGRDPPLELGLATFGVENKWVAELTPDIRSVIDAITSQFGDTTQASQACQNVNTGGTSIGSGFRFLNEYVEIGRNERIKDIEILVTDGNPNSTEKTATTAATYCGVLVPCTFSSTDPRCVPDSKKYTACNLGTSGTFVDEIGKNGLRYPKVDAYPVTISVDVSQEVKDLLAKYATKSYDAVNATELGDRLEEIFGQIITTVKVFRIRKIVPTL